MHSTSQLTFLFFVFSQLVSAAGRGTTSDTGIAGWGADIVLVRGPRAEEREEERAEERAEERGDTRTSGAQVPLGRRTRSRRKEAQNSHEASSTSCLLISVGTSECLAAK